MVILLVYIWSINVYPHTLLMSNTGYGYIISIYMVNECIPPHIINVKHWLWLYY